MIQLLIKHNPWRTPSVSKLIRMELETSERQLLEVESKLEYYTHAKKMLEARTSRLRKAMDEKDTRGW